MKMLHQLKKQATGRAVLIALHRLYNNPRRWIKGRSTNTEYTACCLSGGIRVLSASNEARVEARDLLSAAIANANHSGEDSIIDFNDAKHRKLDQIRKVLRKAYKS